MHRIWYVVALALLATGLYGLHFVAPITQGSDAETLEVRFPGSYAAPGTVVVREAGEYAIWASGGPERDASRCRVTAPAGAAVPVTVASTRVLWTVAEEDDAVYTWVAGFPATQPGTYGLQCRPDPAAPGATYSVTERPDTGPAIRRAVAGGVGVLLAVALAAATVLRRRRRSAARS